MAESRGGAKEKKKSYGVYPISAFCCLWQSVTPLCLKIFSSPCLLECIFEDEVEVPMSSKVSRFHRR